MQQMIKGLCEKATLEWQKLTNLLYLTALMHPDGDGEAATDPHIKGGDGGESHILVHQERQCCGYFFFFFKCQV